MQRKVKPSLIVIVGQTASGKTALAIEVAKLFDGEIICADSRTIYRGMDIGTAKPTAEEQAAVRHHLIDVVEPDETFSAAEFKKLANKAIEDISSRGKMPILVGGTGLYVDAVIYDFKFRSAADTDLRKQLEIKTVEELQAEIVRLGYVMPENERNKRYLIRTIESAGEVSVRGKLRPNILVIGLTVDREILQDRIKARVDQMVSGGFVEECKTLVEKYGPDAPGFKAPGYKAFIPYLNGEIELEEAKARFVSNDLHLAKRQRTWFKRNISIQWFAHRSEAVEYLTTIMNK